MLNVTIEQASGSTRMGTQQWVEVTDIDQAKRVISKLLGLWWLELTPAGGLGWNLRLDEDIELFIVEVLLIDGELIIGKDDDATCRIVIPEPR